MYICVKPAMLGLVGEEVQEGINSLPKMGCSEHVGGTWRVEAYH